MARIIVIGGSGNVGSRVVGKLTAQGHDVVAASRRTGVDSYTGAGLKEALAAADVVVDVTQAPSYAPEVVRDFFTTSTSNLLAAEREAGVSHHVALSVVSTNRPQGVAYFSGKAAQEALIRESGVPFSIVHATQFFEFAKSIMFTSTHDGEIRVADALVQPIASEDAATAVARTATGSPVGDIEIAGPEVVSIQGFVQRTLIADGDARVVTAAADAPYFGALIAERTLLPEENAQLSETRLDEWLSVSVQH